MAKNKGELKNIQKTIRMTEAVYDYINSMDGVGFNQKFENAILMEERYENIRRGVSELEKYREVLEQEICQLREVIMEMEKVLDGVSRVKKL